MLEETLRKDLEYLDLTEDMTQNRAQWRSRIHIADPTYWEKGFVVVVVVVVGIEESLIWLLVIDY